MHQQNDVKTIAFDVIIILLGAIGTIGCFVLTYQLPVSIPFLGISLLLSFLYFFYVYSKDAKRRNFLLIGILIYIIFILLNFKQIQNGILYCINSMLKVYELNSQYTFRMFTVNVSGSSIPMLLAKTLWVIFTPVLAFLIRTLRQRRNYIIAWVITLPFLFSILLFTLLPNWTFFLMVLSFYIALLGMQVASHHRNHSVSDTITYLGGIFAILGFCFMLFLGRFIPMESYARDSRIEALRIQIQSDIKNMIEGTTSKTLGESDLRTAQNRYYFGIQEFVVEASKPQTIYLHGFSANRYEDNVWYAPQDLNSSLYGKDRVHPFNLANEMLLHVDQTQKEEYQNINQVIVKDIRDPLDYIYSPYYITSDLSKRSYQTIADYYMLQSEKKVRSYEFNVLEIDPILDYGSVKRSAYQNEYYEANRKENLQVPQDLLALFQELYIPGIEVAENDQDKIVAIQSFMKSFGSYTLTPGGVPDDQDFVRYFLSESKVGYCVHYASTATLLLRYYGVPARYAEGYHVNAGAFVKGEAIIKDEDAHAWVEVLDPVFGWVPLEVTPASSANVDEEEVGTPILHQPMSGSPASTPQNPTGTLDPTNPVNDSTFEFSWTFVLLFFVVVGILVLPVRSLLVMRHRRRQLQQANAREGILCAGSYLQRLRRYGVSLSKNSLNILEEAKFSNHLMNRDQQVILVKEINQCVQECATSLSLGKKFMFYLIHALG